MKKEIHEIIGEYVHQKRLQNELNSTQFAKLVGVARSTIFNVEHKIGTCVSVSTMNSILLALGISWTEFASILDENNRAVKEEQTTEQELVNVAL